jgi:WD40 repeat protein
VGEFEAHRGGVTQLRFTKRGAQLVSAGNDGTLLMWPPCGSGRVRTIFADEGRRPIVACDVSPDGELLAVATSDDPLRVVDTRSGAVRAVLDHSGETVEAVRFSPDARRLAVWSNAEVSLWDLDSGTRCWTADAGLAEPRPTSLWNISPRPHASWRPALEFSHDGALLASAGWDAVVRMWRPDNGDQLGELRAHGTAVYAIAFQDYPRRLVAGYVGRIAVWDLDRHPGMLSRKVSPGLERTCVAISGKAQLMAWGDAAESAQGIVSVMSIVPPYDVATWPAHAAPLEALAFAPDGRRLATADRGGNVTVWDVASHAKLHTWRAGDTPVRALAFSPDGTRIATGNVDGELQIRDSSDGFLEQSWIAHRGLILAIAFSPDGKRLASAGADWQARLWELDRRSLVNEWRHDEWVNAVAFSPDGERLATGSADLTIRTGRPEAQPDVEIRTAHAHWVNAVAFLDRGRVLVSAGNDGAIRFWDARSGRELATWPSQWGPVHSLALTHDERFLAIGAAGAVRLVELGAAAELIRQEAPRRR